MTFIIKFFSNVNNANLISAEPGSDKNASDECRRTANGMNISAAGIIPVPDIGRQSNACRWVEEPTVRPAPVHSHRLNETGRDYAVNEVRAKFNAFGKSTRNNCL